MQRIRREGQQEMACSERDRRNQDNNTQIATERAHLQLEFQAERAVDIDIRQRERQHQESLHPIPTSSPRKRKFNINRACHFNGGSTDIQTCLEEEHPKFVQATAEVPPPISSVTLRRFFMLSASTSSTATTPSAPTKLSLRSKAPRT
ncbi:hypothetical protein OCU04_011175 [Sclerotinia nivalis]|uniref:Uncharacterized protein n=1 Tax=Sclerotinia nivalis TaxID=352851 RepID=A0A9X0AB78_9HELO|nr:hypothetical protein OCU04_011175 [Sclerotinia nivalis]